MIDLSFKSTDTWPTVVKRLINVVRELEARVEFLEHERPGRRPKPMMAPNIPGVCGLDAERDSATCEDASIYRYQKQCRGTACVQKNQEYYSDYRAGSGVKVEVRPTFKVAKIVRPSRVRRPA